MSIDASSGLIQWTPGEVGGSSNPVTVRVSDAAGNYVEQTFSVTIQAVNAAPSAVGQQVRVASNGSKAITLSGDDGDPDAAQTLSYAITSGPSHGQITGFDPERKLDTGIVGARWLTLDEVRATRERHRSPLILQCIEDYLAGKRYPLELITHYP